MPLVPDGRSAPAEVGNQVRDWLDAGREPDEGARRGLACPPAPAFPGRLDAAEAAGREDQPGRRDNGISVRRVAGELERQQRPEATRHLRAGDGQRRGRSRPDSARQSPAGAPPGTRRRPARSLTAARSAAAASSARGWPARLSSGPAIPPPSVRQLRSSAASAGSRVMTAPSIRSEWPDADLVSEHSEATAPRSSGRCSRPVATVLSTIIGAPAAAASRPSAARSATRSSGFVGVSAHSTAPRLAVPRARPDGTVVLQIDQNGRGAMRAQPPGEDAGVVVAVAGAAGSPPGRRPGRASGPSTRPARN